MFRIIKQAAHVRQTRKHAEESRRYGLEAPDSRKQDTREV